MDADVVEAKDLARATELRERARKLYLRARDYGLRGLEVDFPGLREALARDPKAALARAKKEQVPLLYWTAMGWAGALSLKVNDSEVSADQPDRRGARPPRARARRGLGPRARSTSSSSRWEAGALHDRRLDGAGPRALREGPRLRGDRRAFPYVTYAESVGVATQDKAQFQELLEKALAIDVSQPDGPASRQPHRPEARPLAARAAGRALHRVAARPSMRRPMQPIPAVPACLLAARPWPPSPPLVAAWPAARPPRPRPRSSSAWRRSCPTARPGT